VEKVTNEGDLVTVEIACARDVREEVAARSRRWGACASSARAPRVSTRSSRD